MIAVHAITDFYLQTDKLVRQKEKVRFLLLHAAVHAALTYLVLQAWTCWQAPLLVLVVHFLIDHVKQRCSKDTATAFSVDQIVHVLSLLALTWILVRYDWISGFSGIGFRPLVVVAGFIATVVGSGLFIDRFVRRLKKENKLELDGLLSGGKMIGQLERALIFLFIFIGQPMGIGFLVAAKSILRFEEAKNQKLAEYVLIGTLLSFSLAIALASVTKWSVKV